jgi:ribosomal protein S19E (S16A)
VFSLIQPDEQCRFPLISIAKRLLDSIEKCTTIRKMPLGRECDREQGQQDVDRVVAAIDST